MKHSNRLWRRFAAAYAANISADRLVDLTVPLIALVASGDLAIAGIYLASASAGKMAVGPFLSSTVQRHAHLYWTSIANMIQGVALAVFAVSVVSDFVPVLLVTGIGLIAGCGSGLFSMVSQATVRAIVQKRYYFKANAHLEIIDSLFTLVIPLTAGILADTLGAGFGIGLAAALLSGAAALRWGMPPTSSSGSRGRHRPAALAATCRQDCLNGTRILGLPFQGRIRRMISIHMLVLATLGSLLIPVATYRIHDLGGSGTSTGIAISAAGAGGLLAAWLAGRFAKLTSNTVLSCILLVISVSAVPLMMYAPSVIIVAACVFVCDALASWLYVSLPSYRMASESESLLVDVSSGMLTVSSFLGVMSGLLLSWFGQAPEIYMLTFAVAVISITSALVSFCTGRPQQLEVMLHDAQEEGHVRDYDS